MPTVKQQEIAIGILVVLQGPNAGSIGLILNV